VRLAKYLARAGVASRRWAEELIWQGRVKVNGEIIKLPQTQVNESDEIKVDGNAISGLEKKQYIILNKPSGYISTVSDTHGRSTVTELVENVKERLYPVGRLDADTSGVLIMTNDGELAHRLTHPRYRVEKIYHARVKGIPSKEALAALRTGLYIEGEKTAPAGSKLIYSDDHNHEALLEITLTEGKKRQVKKMCEEIGHPVISLKRISFAGLDTGNLEAGAYRFLTEKEVNYLYRLVKL